MRSTRFIILLVFLWGTGIAALRAQNSQAVSFRFKQERSPGGETLIRIQAILQAGIKLCALKQRSPDAISSAIQFDSSGSKYLDGPVQENEKGITEFDPDLNLDMTYFRDSVTWQQKLSLPLSDSLQVKGLVSYMYKKGEEYIAGEEKFRLTIPSLAPGEVLIHPAKSGKAGRQSLAWIFLAAFGGGLLALLTPCVYSMIPVTVSFFTKRSKTRAEGIRNASYYAVSIVSIFTGLGFLVTLVFGPAALNNLATNWIANLVFFTLFLFFGISFLGAFEISLPASWANRSDARAGTGNFLAIFFMALTLVLVSFSCTGPIIGNLLVLAAQGNYWGPLTGMFGFSLALALPFALFAFFPSKLNILGRAGGWLNAVKVSLGFLELALALKFLSNADLVKGWRLLDREVFLSLWIVLFLLLGLYLLGKLSFHHDDKLPENDFGIPYLSVPRLFFAILTLAFTVYMIPGLWGAPLKGISAFVPPMGTQDFIQGKQQGGAPDPGAASGLPKPVRYHDEMKIYEPEVVTTYGMITYYDYAEALAVARQERKPLMLDFTGINCVNCRKMEGKVWSDPEVMNRLKSGFIIASLYVDVQHIELPATEQYYSAALGKKVETLGDKNADLQVSVYKANSQPYYFFLDAEENKLLPEGYGYDPDIRRFISLLDTAKARYHSIAAR